MSGLSVVAAGVVLAQDIGRPQAHTLGFAHSGAFDRGALRRANRLVGNPEGVAALEVLGGCLLRAEADLVVAVSGADVPVAREHERGPDLKVTDLPTECAFDMAGGTLLRVGAARSGLRCYIAVRGGLRLEPVLDSASYDTLSRIGPPPFVAGDLIAIGGAAPLGVPWRERLPVRGAAFAGGAVELRVLPGPHREWLIGDLCEQVWQVDSASDRVGVRLTGSPVERIRGELEPVPMVPGAIQVPPSGLPIILGPDGGATGGYPVVACVIDADRDLLAQVRPGDHVRLRWM